MAAECFSKGNEAFVEEDYEEAEQHYSSAIEQDSGRDEYFVARAHARIKLENFKDAVSDATKANELNSKNIKAFLRKGVALFHLGEFDSAKDELIQGKLLDGSDKNIATWLRKCEAEIDLARNKLQGASGDSKVAYGCSSVTSQNQDTGPQAVATSTESSSQIAASSMETSPPTITMPAAPKTRYDWYQTETHVILTILVKNVKKEDLQTKLGEQTLNVSIQLSPGSEYSLRLNLSHIIDPEHSQVKIMSTKVEIKLKKVEGFRWEKLEGEQQKTVIKHIAQASAGPDTMKYPSSSQHTRDWDKVVADIKDEEKNEKLEGDAALNQLFQQIYSDGSDEVRKAMNKSFMESGGTVLSTNWSEIVKQKTDVKPPDGMEYKQYSS